MRKNKNRTLILSIASATALLPGCGDSSEADTTSTTDSGQEAAHSDGSAPIGLVGIILSPGENEAASTGAGGAGITTGVVAVPPDASTDQATGVITTGVVVMPPDAGDGPSLIGAVVQPADAGDADAPHIVIGVIIRPEDGSANG